MEGSIWGSGIWPSDTPVCGRRGVTAGPPLLCRQIPPFPSSPESPPSSHTPFPGGSLSLFCAQMHTKGDEWCGRCGWGVESSCHRDSTSKHQLRASFAISASILYDLSLALSLLGVKLRCEPPNYPRQSLNSELWGALMKSRFGAGETLQPELPPHHSPQPGSKKPQSHPKSQGEAQASPFALAEGNGKGSSISGTGLEEPHSNQRNGAVGGHSRPPSLLTSSTASLSQLNKPSSMALFVFHWLFCILIKTTGHRDCLIPRALCAPLPVLCTVQFGGKKGETI